MAKCDFCGKGVTFGIKVSHSHRRSNRTWKPNVQRVKAIVDGQPSVFTLAPVAYVQVRLQEQSNFIDNLNESTDQSLYSGLFLLSKFYRLFPNKLVVYDSVWFVPFFKTSLYYIFIFSCIKNSKNPTPFPLVFCLV